MQKIPILIIDDNEMDRYILNRYLKDSELELTIIEKDDGETAIKFLQEYNENKKTYQDQYPPMLIFLDINMPLMNGFEFLEEFSELKKLFDYEACVVMMFTSSERKEDRDKILSYDFVKDYLVKGKCTSNDVKEKIELYCKVKA